MVIWELQQVGDLFPFYAMQGEARVALRDYRKELGSKKEGVGPLKLTVKTRDELITLLQRVIPNHTDEEDEAASEFL
jgi:hypothetical protein